MLDKVLGSIPGSDFEMTLHYVKTSWTRGVQAIMFVGVGSNPNN